MDLALQPPNRNPRHSSFGEDISMRRHKFSTVTLLAASVIAIGWVAQAPAVSANEGYQLSGPYTHNNLAIYLIHREGGDNGPVPLTLGEAMEQGVVRVTETGDVQELVVRNLGGSEVFIQSGDILKGGKQDRVLVVSMILPPNSGDVPIGAFCVEHGRWAGRGQEKTTYFSESTTRLPLQAARRAIGERMRLEIKSDNPVRLNRRRQPPEDESLQYQVWNSIGKAQMSLSYSVGSDIADRGSPSSLQLSLENSALASALEDYGATLVRLPYEHPDAVGYIFAINGKIYSGDEFGSAGLFRKLWLRQLKAASTEAIAEHDMVVREQPTLTEVAAFIDGVRAAEPVGKFMPGRMSLEMRETERALRTEIRRQNGSWVHRSFVAYW